MRPNKVRIILITVCAVWALTTGAGIRLLWAYENEPGPATTAPATWPTESKVRRAINRATLIMLAHPRCPCTRASIGELARLMAQAQGRVTAYVLFVKPAGTTDDWEKTDLWQSAASIPGVTVIVDDGTEARRFQAVTSGQTSLYDVQGQLLFNGGITASRGHSGDNAGRTAIVSLLSTRDADTTETPTFGCPLFGDHSNCMEKAHEPGKQ